MKRFIKNVEPTIYKIRQPQKLDEISHRDVFEILFPGDMLNLDIEEKGTKDYLKMGDYKCRDNRAYPG